MPLPVEIKGQIIYYVGPDPGPPGKAVGSAGPTSSYRMDSYTPALLGLGLKATIGKGQRGSEVRKAMLEQGAVYLAAVGGAGALISESIESAEVVAWPELGPEAHPEDRRSGISPASSSTTFTAAISTRKVRRRLPDERGNRDEDP